MKLHTNSLVCCYVKLHTDSLVCCGVKPTKKEEIENGRERIKDKVVTIVPVDSFIGTLLMTEKASHVVKAYPKNDIFAQHSVFALETMETGLHDVEDRSPLSYYVEDSVEEFLSTTLATFDERREFVDEVFSVIDAME